MTCIQVELKFWNFEFSSLHKKAKQFSYVLAETVSKLLWMPGDQTITFTYASIYIMISSQKQILINV